ncbi:MAG: glutamate--tRNA ligase [Candidatus Caenarcaniphilales bacterium]|jgi:nondiscriminating glutamyl-tRNA synthetase|nr:glutamate--tRNA ligase [Candidatus Caenarcaniphilales bacterium]
MSSKIVTRIAPSPTGNLHLGTVRTALYNVLLAKKENGKFLFRLEDTDRERSKEEFTQEIVEGFNWLGIDWDIPDNVKHDESGMVRQSERNDIHSAYVQKLLDSKKAYKCFASPQELEAMRAAQKVAKLPEGYDNRGRNLSEDESLRKEQAGEKFVVRLNLGEARDIKWHDLVRGEMSINTKDLGGDPVIQKFDGQVLYNFAVVIDDYEMQVTHVFRGEDHLSNTAKQIAIYEAFEFPVPSFGHLPLIFTTDKQKLSKRKHGDIAGVEKYRHEGYLPAALANYLVATSYTAPKDTTGEVYTLEEAIKHFDPHGLSKSPAIYDLQKLNWYNREYIAKLSHEQLLGYLKPFLKYDLSNFTPEDQKLLIDNVRGSIDKFADINTNIAYLFEEIIIDDSLKKFLVEGQVVNQALLAAIENNEIDMNSPVDIKNKINLIGESLSLKGKQLFWPIRIAVSFSSHGPDLGAVIYLLGREKTIERLKNLLK